VIRSLALAAFVGPGCGGPPLPPPAAPASPVVIGSGSGAARTFGAGEEIPPASFPFDGGPGYVRITLEADRTAGDGQASAASLNDVLFRASGRGRIVVSFRKAWPGHDEGRVTVRCEGVGEDSSADFEPGLWSRDGSAPVAFSSPVPGPGGPFEPDTEIVLARYAAKLGSGAVALTVKATFSTHPPQVRVQGKAGSR